MKFKVGDKVRVKTGLLEISVGLEEEHSFVGVVGGMLQYEGKEAVVEFMGWDSYLINLDDNLWCWDDNLLEEI